MLVAGTACTLMQPALRVQAGEPAVVGTEEHAETIAALKPPKRHRPIVAVLGQNDGTETTDYLVPYGVLKQSGLADVWALATARGPLKLHPALTIQPQATTAEFEARHPDGADYVIVRAMHRPDDAAVLAFIAGQAAKGATIVGVCSGAKVLSNAGLLRDRAATGHWYDIDELKEGNPSMRWMRDRRYVADRGVVTTTGVTASVPVSLAIVEAIGGREAASTLAGDLGARSWEANHDSDAFRLDSRHFWTAVGNTVAFWSHETVGIHVDEGVDEIALALTADAYSRTYQSQAVTVAGRPDALTTRRGIRLVPDRAAKDAGTDLVLGSVERERPTQALDASLDGIAERYGRRTAAFVALQLEYRGWRAARGAR